MAISLMLSVLTACGSEVENKKILYDDNAFDSIPTSTVTSNSNYELLWQDDAKFVMLKDIKTGKVWSTIPYEYYNDMGGSANVNSTFNITVSNAQTLKWDTVNGFNEAFLDGRITCSEIEDGLKVTYYFDKFKISVPVIYKLREDSLEMSIDPTQISEGEEYTIVAVSPAPFLCSAKNSKNDSYLFVPTGSGALMYTDERVEGDRIYSGHVYGEDASHLDNDASPYEEAIRLPVYGVRDKEDAMLAIIESGSESANITATAGNSRTGYSNIYSSFYLRGNDEVSSGVQSLNYEDITKISKNISTKLIKVGFYPLKEKSADYMGMVERYKQYLSENKLINENEDLENTFGLNIYGGVLTSATVFGMPNKTLKVLTDFSAATEMIKELNEISDLKPEVMLSGFGDSGINSGKIAGGYDFDSKFGGKKVRKALEQYCSENKIGLFTDFDLISYRSTGNGFNYVFDAAKSASLQAVEKSIVEIPLRQFDKRLEYRLLKRSKIQDAVDKLVNFTEKQGVSGIALSSLGSVAYSDYTESQYYCKGNLEIDVAKYIEQIKKANHKVAVSAANAYAAASGDVLFNSPVSNGNYYVFDTEIPFYEMVFAGSKSIYSEAVNISSDFEKQIMLSMIGGARLSFALVQEFDTAALDFQSERLYATVYENNRDLIKQTLEKYGSFYTEIAGSKITNYEIIDSFVSKTFFDNGVVLYANHSAKKVDSSVGEFEAYETKWIKE